DDFEAAVRDQKERRENMVAERERNKELRASKRDAKAAMEARWEEMKREHEKAVEEWQQGCQALEAQNIPKKDWPKKPCRPLRRNLEAEF
ncbi:hypothetical protein M378DRAFT_56344, partial [Amanita muscaria Koide BX008]